MGRWDKQEQQSIQQQIRELVLSVNSRGLNEKSMGIIVPLRVYINTNRWYGNGKHRFVTGVYIDSEKPTRDRLIGNDTYLEQYTSDDNSLRIHEEVLNQLKGMFAINSLTMAKLYESPDKSLLKAFFCGSDAFYLDDIAVEFQIKDSKTPSYIHRDIAVIDYNTFNDFVVQNIVRTSRELANRNIVLPMDDGRARILFNGSHVNLLPQDNINISNDMGIEAMRMIAEQIDPTSSVTVPEDGFVIKHPVEAVFSDQYVAREFLMDYKNRYNLASIAVLDLLHYDIKNFSATQKHWIEAYLLENGGKHPETRMVAANNLMEYALCFASLKSVDKQNEVRQLLKCLATKDEKKLGDMITKGVTNKLPYPADDIVIIDEGPMAGEYVRIHGWTDDDPALLYSFTDVSVYFNDTTTHKAENIENEDGIDAYKDRKGFFMIKSEDYVRAYEQVEAHDNAILEEIRAGHIVELKNFLEYALPQVGHSLDFKNEDVRVKYISAAGEQSKELKNLAHINGGFVMTGKDGYAVGIEHLTNGSAIRLLQQSREQLARDTIFARTTGPCNHFIEEELESLKHCTKHISEPAKKQEFLMKALDGLAKQFKAERTSSEWIDDVREELQDLSKGIVRGEGLGRK